MLHSLIFHWTEIILIAREAGNVGEHMEYLVEIHCLQLTYYSPFTERLDIQDEELYSCKSGNKHEDSS